MGKHRSSIGRTPSSGGLVLGKPQAKVQKTLAPMGDADTPRGPQANGAVGLKPTRVGEGQGWSDRAHCGSQGGEQAGWETACTLSLPQNRGT